MLPLSLVGSLDLLDTLKINDVTASKIATMSNTTYVKR